MDDETKKRKIATVLRWTGAVVFLAVGSPLIFLALKGALGLAALGVVAVIGTAAIRLAPVASQMLPNAAVKLMLSEARRNPIETLVNRRAEKAKELEAASAQIVDFEAEVMGYDQKTTQFSKDYPDEAPQYRAVSAQMHAALEAQKADYTAAVDELEESGRALDKARAIYSMALAAQRVTALSKSSEAKVFAEIREKAALDAVQTSLNKSFAKLSTSVAARHAIQSASAKSLPEVRS